MIKHIVCFKLKDNSKEKCEEARNILLSMKGNVPTALIVDAHVDELHSPRSYDVMVVVTLHDWRALEEYQWDKYHCGVVKKYMHDHTLTSISMDYEL